MRKLVDVDGVQAIVTNFTNTVTAQLPLADQLKVPIFAPIETPGLLSSSPYSFAHSATIAQIGAMLRDYWKKVGYKRIYALLLNNGFGHLAL